MSLVFLAWFMIVAMPAESAAVEKSEIRLVERIADGYKGRLGFGGPDSQPVAEELVRFLVCLAHRGKSTAPCAALRRVSGEEKAGLKMDEVCRMFYHLNSLAVAAAQRRQEEALTHCGAIMLLFGAAYFGKDTKPVCSAWSDAYRSSYFPLCSLLASDYYVGLYPEEFGYQCRTLIYVPNKNSCRQIKARWRKKQCLTQALLVKAAKERNADFCGHDSVCRAAITPNAEDCGSLEMKLRKFTEKRNEKP